ncbi:MAG TPA: hypothetical protein VFF73_14840 [Planctomycetota bacterium]|nr:hypothetical protein [Planctomycetota bacterium]
MSYDLSLFRPRPGFDPTSNSEDSNEFEPKARDPVVEEQKRRVADALIRTNAELEPFQLRYAEIAKFQGITEEEARRRFRYIELNGPKNGNGVQITIFDSRASIHIPFWHTGDKAFATLREVWSYLRVFASHGFATYDPQIERVLNVEADFKLVIDSYGAGVEFTRDVADRIRRGEIDPETL